MPSCAIWRLLRVLAVGGTRKHPPGSKDDLKLAPVASTIALYSGTAAPWPPICRAQYVLLPVWEIAMYPGHGKPHQLRLSASENAGSPRNPAACALARGRCLVLEKALERALLDDVRCCSCASSRGCAVGAGAERAFCIAADLDLLCSSSLPCAGAEFCGQAAFCLQ